MIQKIIADINTEKNEIKKFGITIGVILFIIASIFYYWNNTNYLYFIILGFFLFIFGIIRPDFIKPIFYSWMIFASILGWFMTRLVLCILYYLLVTPIGLIGKIFGKQFIELRWDKTKRSYWNKLSNKKNNTNYEKQY